MNTQLLYRHVSGPSSQRTSFGVRRIQTLVSRPRQETIERYSFVTVTTQNLERARDFWVNALEFPVAQEQIGQYFIVNAGT